MVRTRLIYQNKYIRVCIQSHTTEWYTPCIEYSIDNSHDAMFKDCIHFIFLWVSFAIAFSRNNPTYENGEILNNPIGRVITSSKEGQILINGKPAKGVINNIDTSELKNEIIYLDPNIPGKFIQKPNKTKRIIELITIAAIIFALLCSMGVYYLTQL